MRFRRDFVLFCIGGVLYLGLELLWRGWTHPSMFLLGGLCFLLISRLGSLPAVAASPLLGRAILSAGLVTLLEFFSGLLLNVVLGLGVWDYSGLPYNLLGQVCLYFFLLWIPVCMAAIVAADLLQHLLFRVPLPRYHLF